MCYVYTRPVANKILEVGYWRVWFSNANWIDAEDGRSTPNVHEAARILIMMQGNQLAAGVAPGEG